MLFFFIENISRGIHVIQSAFSIINTTLNRLATSLLTLCKDSISFTSLSKYNNFFHKPQRLKNATLLVFRVDDVIKTFHFPVLFQTATFEIQRCLFSAYHFPVLFQTTTFEMQRYLFSEYHFPILFQAATFEIQHLKCNVACFLHIIFPYFFKNKSSFTTKKTQRLKIQRYYLFP